MKMLDLAQADLQHKVEPIVRKAGEILLSYFQKQLVWKDKGSHGFVTEADLAVEDFLIKSLELLIPGVDFFAEESGERNNGSDYCWVIDPLDGTTNFAYGLPYFCISVALTYKQKPVFGMIYQPLLDELFYAERAKGAFLNGQRIKIAESRPMEKTLLMVGFPYSKGEEFVHVLQYLEKISKQTYAFRHLGAIALDLAYTACGRSDGIFFEGLGWWDVAAGTILIQEAGGMATTYSGGPITPEYESYVAANQRLHTQLLNVFKENGTARD